MFCENLFKLNKILFAAINVTLPDEKSNYVHRIGRVGRAERMGLAISLVSSVPEKVSKIVVDYICIYFEEGNKLFYLNELINLNRPNCD